MPTYQYICTSCATPHEAVQSFSDAALTQCPSCDGQLRKVYSAVGVVFKGSGFYKNDSRAATSDGVGSDGAAGSGVDKGGDKAAEKAADKAGDSGAGKAGGKGADAGPGKSGGDAPAKADTPAKTGSAPATKAGKRTTGSTPATTPA